MHPQPAEISFDGEDFDTPTQEGAEPEAPQTSRLAELAGGMGYEIVDVTGFLSRIDDQARNQLMVLCDLKETAEDMGKFNTKIHGSASSVSESTDHTLELTKHSAERVQSATKLTRDVASWVQSVEQRIAELSSSVGAITTDIDEIAQIAKMVNILALNASIEAYRAGEAGRGFAIVAKEVNELSHKTEHAAASITRNIESLSRWTSALRSEARKAASDAEEVIEGTNHTNDALGRITSSIEGVSQEAHNIRSQADEIRKATDTFIPCVEEVIQASHENAEGVTQANERISQLIDRSESIVQETAALGGASVDTPYIDHVLILSKQISELFDDAVDQNKIDLDDLFDESYQPIPNSDPRQHMTRFVHFTDRHLPEIQEKALQFDSKVAFCAAVDRNGFLPTHNQKFSKPPGSDPVWNAANCRNRRIFNDRVGLKAGRNQDRFLLQVYRREMGGGQFVIMKDLSAPIWVKGRHWGGLRFAYFF